MTSSASGQSHRARGNDQDSPESLLALSKQLFGRELGIGRSGCYSGSRSAAKPESPHKALCLSWSLIGWRSPDWIAGSGR